MSDGSLKPSTGLAALAASFAIVFPIVAFVLLLGMGGPESALRLLQEGGVWAYAVLGMTALSAIACAILVFLAGRGARVPLALPIGIAAMPWIAGMAGARVGASTVAAALSFADPAAKATIVAAGISESMTSRLLGGWLASSLLAAVGCGLALASIGQRAPNRRGAAALLALLALPFGALAGWQIVSFPDAIFLAPAVLGALLSTALAGAGAGGDAPHGRAAALAAAAPIAAGLGFAASAVAIGVAQMREVFGLLATVGSADRISILARAAEEMRPMAMMPVLAAIATLVAAGAVAVWAITRARPSAGRITGGVLVVLVAIGVVALDRVAVSGMSAVAEGIVRSPWADVPGFTPLALADTEADLGSHHAIVARDRVTLPGGAAVPIADAATDAGRTRLVEAFRAALANPSAVGQDFFRVEPARPTLRLAVDRTLPASTLIPVLRAAGEAGATSVTVLGESVSAGTPDERARIREAMPILSGILESPAGVTVQLRHDDALAPPDADPRLYHATIGANPAVPVQVRAGAADPGITLDPATARRDPFAPGHSIDPEDPRILYLAIGPGATAASLFGAASAASAARYAPVLALDGIPGHPETPLPEASTAGMLGTIGLGRIGTISRASGETGGGFGAGGTAGLVTSPATTPVVTGSMSREIIQRVIRRHLTQIRYCYEQQLVADPTLTGRVDVSFTIGTNGAVADAEVRSTTLGNAAVETCILEAVRRFQFPSPEGGVVRVNYPFVLRPA